MIINSALSLLIIVNTVKCTNFKENIASLTIDQGTLLGEKSLNYWDEPFYNFIGIPYAKPPIGELRFKAPEPAESWTGIYDATKIRPVCTQIFLYDELNNLLQTDADLEQDENCLFLNVHSKMTKKLKPVMVWIHGGGLEFGSIFERTYGPEFLMTEDIVLVKIAYRLSIFGFLSIDDPKYNIPGNAGLKDQVLALKWIQKNIHHFGGDPNQVTIFGESAGAASVHMLQLSPMAKGLFHRIIAQSGAANEPWLTAPHNYPELATALQCNKENLDDIVECIKSASAEDILDAYKTIKDSAELQKKLRNGEIFNYNYITIEKSNPNGFLTQNPIDIVKSGIYNKVPIIFGVTTHEGDICLQSNPVRPNVTDYRLLIPKDIKIDFDSEEAYQLGQQIKEFYYGDKKPSNDLIDPYVDFGSDALIVTKAYQFAKLQASTVPVYFYHFDYYTKLNLRYAPNAAKQIITHSDDLHYLFYVRDKTPKKLDKQSDEYVGVHRMIKLWTTFATSKNADPNPENDPLLKVKWLPVKADKFNYLRIAKDMELKENPFEERMKFWENIYAKTFESGDMFCKADEGNCK